jgi:hypothetical protein
MMMMMLLTYVLACCCGFARGGRVISRVAVRGRDDSKLPAISLSSEAAVKICAASRRSPLLLRWAWKRQRDALCEDAKRAYFNKGYLVNIRPPTVRYFSCKRSIFSQALFDGGSPLLILEARSLVCARPAVKINGVEGKKLRTRPNTVARALGLKPGRPFRFDDSKWRRLSALFHASASHGASVVGDEVTYEIDDIKERRLMSLQPEVR